jgi:integrase
LRREEILALRWSTIDLERRFLSVREALEETTAGGIRSKEPKSKTGKRDVLLPDIVVEALRDRRRRQLEQRLALGAGKLTGDMLVFGKLEGGRRARTL